MVTLAFTGHRPKDLPYPAFSPMEFDRRIGELVKQERVTHFVTGGALGVDTLAASHANMHDIPFTLVLPFEPDVMWRFWREHDRCILRTHMWRAADVVIIGGDRYDPAMYQKRNEHMVDMADILAAVWTGKPTGGTANCLRYAQQVERRTIYLYGPSDF